MYRTWRRGPLDPCGVTPAALADWSRHLQPFSRDGVGSAGAYDDAHQRRCSTLGRFCTRSPRWLTGKGTA